VGKVLVLLTLCAPLDVCFDPRLHPRPVVQFGDFSDGLVLARVSAESVVILVKYHSFELVVRWDSEFSPVVVPKVAVAVELLAFKPSSMGFLSGDEH